MQSRVASFSPVKRGWGWLEGGVPNRAQFRSWTQLPGAAVKLQAAVCCGSERICSGESPAKLAGANLAQGKAMRAGRLITDQAVMPPVQERFCRWSRDEGAF